MMHKISVLTGLLLFLYTMQPRAQVNSEALSQINANFDRISFYYLLFFEQELIQFYSDSSNQKKVKTEISRQKTSLSSSNEESKKERIVFLSILRERIINTKSKNKESQIALIKLLEEFKIDFPVDEKLLESRLSSKKRGLPYGDEECDKDLSFYIFFLYDPALYLKVLGNKVVNPTAKISFPTKCFLEELNPLPVTMKQRIQKELLLRIKGRDGAGYDELNRLIKNADLNAKFD